MKRWLSETHGVKFELFRHFLLRMFESEMFASKGRWQTVVISLFAAILPASILFGNYAAKYRYLSSLPSPVPFQSAAVADELSILMLLMALSGIVALLQWQSLFPSRKDYCVLSALPIRSRQIFLSRFAAVFCFITGVVVTAVLASFVIPAQMTGRWQKNPSAVVTMGAHVVATVLACYFMFAAVMGLQGALLHSVPRRWFQRLSVYVQGIGMALCFLGALFSWTISEWNPETIALLPHFGRWLPPVWFVGLHEKLLGDSSPFFVMMSSRAMAGFALAGSLMLLTYFAAYARYRILLVEVRIEPSPSRSRSQLPSFLAREPEAQAVLHFMTKTLSRSRTHRVVLLAYIGASIGLVFNAVLLSHSISSLKETWFTAVQFLVLFAPVALSVVLLAGFKHTAALPAELRANWMFRSAEAIGRAKWMQAVECFVVVYVLGPIYMLFAPLALLALGWQLTTRMVALQVLTSLTIFEVLFANWQQLPFTCSYLPGKRQLMATVARILASLGIFVPIVCLTISVISREWRTFVIGAPVFTVTWWWTRIRRLDGWGTLNLVYEDVDVPVLQLGIATASLRQPILQDSFIEEAVASRPSPDARSPELQSDEVSAKALRLPTFARVGLQVYRVFAKTFPREFRNVYGDEMLRTTQDAIGTIWRFYGILGLLHLLIDVAVRLVIEHLTLLWEDTRYGMRVFARSPGFTIVAMISLTLGICIATCADSEMNGMILRNLPAVSNPDELAGFQMPVSYPDYKRYRELQDLFSATLAYMAPVPFAVVFDGRTERTWGHLVTPSYFATMGVRPLLGRDFDQQDEKPGQQASIMVSYRFWQGALGGDPSVVGRTLRLNGQPVNIVGVGPKDFLGASPALFMADIWMPLSAGERIASELAGNALERRDLKMFHVVARLQPGVPTARAEAELDSVARQLAKSYGEAETADQAPRVLLVVGGKLLPFRKQDMPLFTEFFMVLAGLVLLIACTNVANMMLARAADRRKEVAIRLALGASRLRIIRQLLTESMMIAAAAGLLGLLLSVYLMHLLSRMRMPFPMPITYDLHVDWRALVFTSVVTMLTGLAFGLAPALQATRVSLTPALKEGGQIQIRRHRRLSLRNALLLAQLAGSLMLLLILGLLALGIQGRMGIEQGFDARNLYLVSVDPVRDGYSGEQAEDFLHKLLERVQRLPSIVAASLTESLPAMFSGDPGVTFSTTSGGAGRAKEILWAAKYVVGKDYFLTAGIPILSGRAFRKDDETDNAQAVIVSRELVRRVWNGQDPLGRRIEIGNDDISPGQGAMPGSFDFRATSLDRKRRAFEVVGVAGDVAHELVVQKPSPAVYFPLRPADYAQPSLVGVTLMVRAVPGLDTLEILRREIATMDPNITPFNARSMTQQIDEFMVPLHTASWTYGCIGIFGLVLAAVGLAGVTAYSVVQRTHEIGVRLALGAKYRDVLAMVMKESVVLVALGTVAGMTGAWAGMRLMSGLFSSVASTSASNPVLVVGTPLLLAGLALMSCYLPARRSMRIDPATALRQE